MMGRKYKDPKYGYVWVSVQNLLLVDGIGESGPSFMSVLQSKLTAAVLPSYFVQ